MRPTWRDLQKRRGRLDLEEYWKAALAAAGRHGKPLGFMHRRGVETPENALAGVVAGLRGLGAGGTFEGVAFYAPWTTDEAEWSAYQMDPFLGSIAAGGATFIGVEAGLGREGQRGSRVRGPQAGGASREAPGALPRSPGTARPFWDRRCGHHGPQEPGPGGQGRRGARPRAGGNRGSAGRHAIAEIQSRLSGAAPGQLSLADSEAGALSFAEGEPGRLSLTDPEGKGPSSEQPVADAKPRTTESRRAEVARGFS